MKNVNLIIIDPQNDFCHIDGALFVPGAHDDCVRLAAFIHENKKTITNITVTMDNHPRIHIAHPCAWVDHDGNNPKPFTVMYVSDNSIFGMIGQTHENDREYFPVMANKNNPFIYHEYIRNLQDNNKDPLCIWPEHCINGDKGQTIEWRVADALKQWEYYHFKNVNYVYKGMNPYTEHYGAICAEVQYQDDSSTTVNNKILASIAGADMTLFAGEALSHCVKHTVKYLMDEYQCLLNSCNVNILRDTTSSVPGFETDSEKFLVEAQKKGVKIINTKDLQI